MKKKAVALHTGSLDSSLCLALAIHEFGKNDVLSVSFCQNRRRTSQLKQAATISKHWGVDHIELPIDCSAEKNGLVATLGAMHANSVGAKCIFMGIVEADAIKTGQRDCSRHYIDLKQQLLRLDLDEPMFEIRTPLVHMTKKDILKECYQRDLLKFLLSETISCYQGIPWQGCGRCAPCQLRNEALIGFIQEHPEFRPPFSFP